MKKIIFWIILAVVIIGVAIWYYLSNKKNKPVNPVIGTGALGSYPKSDGTCNSGLVPINGICSSAPTCPTGQTGTYPDCITPLPPLTITKATYGSTDGTAIVDVTSILTSYINNNKIEITADATGQFMNILFTNPAPNIPKQLVVQYKLGTVSFFKTIPDSQSIIIP